MARTKVLRVVTRFSGVYTKINYNRDRGQNCSEKICGDGEVNDSDDSEEAS